MFWIGSVLPARQPPGTVYTVIVKVVWQLKYSGSLLLSDLHQFDAVVEKLHAYADRQSPSESAKQGCCC